MIGQTISHYRILEKLGGGGMGVVYKAQDLNLGRIVALKFLPPELSRASDAKERFVQEARTASSLDHANICTIHEIGEDETGRMFIVMSCYDGETLAEKAQQGPLPVDAVVDIARQIAGGLAAAHAKGIVHRDIKPANVIVTTAGTVKIIDFGLAKLGSSVHLTQMGMTLGTFAYMSPEQSRGEPVDARTDIWALGVVMYELLCGRLPFRGEYEQAVVYSILNEDPQPISEIRPGVPEPLAQAVTKMLQKEPEQRYQSLEDVLEALGAAADSTAVLPIKSPPAGFSRKRLIQYSSLAAAVILMLVFAGLMLQSDEVEADSAAIAVMPYALTDSQTDWQWLRLGIADLLRADLQRVSSVRVLDLQHQLQIMKSIGLRGSDLTPEQALQVARAAHVEKIVTGSLTIEGKRLLANTRIFDAATGDEVAQLPEIEGELADLYGLSDRLSAELFRTLRLRRPKQVSAVVQNPMATASLDAERYYIEGLDAAFDLRHRESIDKLRRAIALDSSFIKPYYYLAWQYGIIGDYASARATLAAGKPLITHLPEEERLGFLTNEASLDGRWHDYANYLERILKLNPYNARKQFLYGWVLYHKFRMIDAGIAEIQKSLQLDSTYSFAYNTLAFAYLARGEKQKSLQTIDKVIARQPTDVNFRDSRAKILRLTGQYDAAIVECEQILALKPQFQYSAVNMARAYLATGRTFRAQAIAEKYLISHPLATARAEGYFLQALASRDRGEMGAAVDWVRKALAENPENYQAYELAGSLAIDNGDLATAKRELDALEAIFQNKEGLEGQWVAQHLKAEIAISEEDFPEARRALRSALQRFPLDRAFYLQALANAQAESGDLRAAAERYREALKFNPNAAEAAWGLALVYEKLGRTGQARQLLRRAKAVWANADREMVPANRLHIQLAALEAEL